MKIAVSGQFWELRRYEVVKIVKAVGGSVQQRVGKTTDILIVGSKTHKSSEVDLANAQNTQVMTLEEFKTYLANKMNIHSDEVEHYITISSQSIYKEIQQNVSRRYDRHFKVLEELGIKGNPLLYEEMKKLDFKTMGVVPYCNHYH